MKFRYDGSTYYHCAACGGRSLFSNRWTPSLWRCNWCDFMRAMTIRLAPVSGIEPD